MIPATKRFSAVLALVCMTLGVSIPAFARVPSPELHPPSAPVEHREVPAVTAPSWIVFDATQGLVLGSVQADVERSMASTTKLMTALVAYELADPNTVVQVSQRAADAGEAEIGLVVGESLLLEDLITVMLVRSANDAAIAVAEAVAGDVDLFVDQMNARTVSLGLTRTSFTNPHGLDAEGHLSTARDLLRLGLAAMTIPEIRDAAILREFDLGPDPAGNQRVAVATNEMIDLYSGAIGVKTGFTFGAGLVLVAAAERDGRTIYAVVMGSEGEGAHFRDAAALLDFGFGGHGFVDAVSGDAVFDGTLVRRTAVLESQMHIAALLGDGSTAVVTAVADIAGEDSEREGALPALTEAFWWWIRGDDA